MIYELGRHSVKQTENGYYVLLEPFSYRDDEVRVTVEQGFTTDFSSVPSRLESFMPGGSKLDRAGIVHDWLYRQRPFSDERRALADRVWRRIAAHDAGRYSAWKGWLGLRMLGWIAYGENNPNVESA